MAASTSNMVKSKSGKLYEASSPQGKMIVTAATTGPDADFDTEPVSKAAASNTMLETLQDLFYETEEQSETLDTIEEHLDDGDNPLDDARDNLKKSNKDKRKSKIAAGLKKAALGAQAGYAKVKESLSGKIGLALLGGGLLLLNKYGDEIAGPDGWLTKFLKYMKEDLIPDVKALYEDLQVWWDIGWKKVTGFFTYIEGIFEKIGAYMDTFDVDDVEGLSQVEVKAMMDDIGKRLFDMVVDSAGGFISGLGSAILAYSIGMPLYKAGVKVAAARVAAAVGGTALATTTGSAAATVGATAAAKGALGVAGKLGLAGIIAGSIIGIYNAGSKAMTASVDEETGKLNFTKYAASFIAGDAEGGFGNAIRNAFTGGPTALGAGIGVTLGIAGGPAGMLIGGLMGAAIGGVVGGITGLIGADNMDKFFQGTVDLASRAVDSVVEFFGGVVAGATSFVKGEGYHVGRNRYIAQHAGSSKERLTKIEDKQIDVDILQQEFDFEKNAKKKRAKELVLNKAKRELARLKAKNVEVEQILTQISEEEIAEAKASLPEMYNTLRAMESGIISKGRGDQMGRNKYDKLIMKIEAAEKIITTRDDGAFRPLNDAERNELSQQAAAGPTEGAFVAKTSEEMFKLAQLVAAQNAKELLLEMKADNAKENKFTTFTSSSAQTNQITNANYVAAGFSARNEMWLHNDQLRAALGN